MLAPAMEVRLGNVVAHCPHCAATEFVHMEPGTPFTMLSDLMCGNCELATTYGELILQISDQAMAEARSRLHGGRPL